MANDEDRSASVLDSPKTQAVRILPVWNTLGTDKKTHWQASELAVPEHWQDIERTSVNASTSVLLGDPFQLSDGIVPDEQITNLRHRTKGKNVAKYQLRQNNVCVARACIYLN
jgi:hypothetical protein